MSCKTYFYTWIGSLLIAVAAMSAPVTLEWDPSISSNVDGYRIYIGGASREYDRTIDAGKATTATISDLESGTWYFSVTAYNDNSESGFSNEVSKTIESFGRCDLNLDGSTDAVDLQILARTIINKGAIGDINNDGTVDAIDLQIMTRVILKKQPCPQ